VPTGRARVVGDGCVEQLVRSAVGPGPVRVRLKLPAGDAADSAGGGLSPYEEPDADVGPSKWFSHVE